MMDVAGGGGLGPRVVIKEEPSIFMVMATSVFKGMALINIAATPFTRSQKRMKVAYVQRYGSKRSFNLHFRGISIKRVTEGK